MGDIRETNKGKRLLLLLLILLKIINTSNLALEEQRDVYTNVLETCARGGMAAFRHNPSLEQGSNEENQRNVGK